jgi:hypothetical protein
VLCVLHSTFENKTAGVGFLDFKGIINYFFHFAVCNVYTVAAQSKKKMHEKNFKRQILLNNQLQFLQKGCLL